jgi:hypothetical protein
MKSAMVVTVGTSSKESLGAMKLSRWLKRVGYDASVEPDDAADDIRPSPMW